ncbi:MAG: glutamate--tRNA ligase, partial [Verrucomicrobiota bacterium]|nr:glutamate--tRNA ligase [Verrucomicrobiota bacterium]
MVRTRFAPSPTGSLHIGGARTALYNYLLAKRYGGSFILRIEDTDKERNTQSSQDQLIQELHWLGLEWDEGPDLEGQDRGDFGPYTQSQRGAVYHKYAQRLLEENKAFYCFASEEAIDQAREQTPNNVTFKFQSPYRDLPLHEAREKLKAGEEAVIRFRNDFHDRVFTMQDAVRGPVDLPSHMIGDFVILRADGSPVYNFCCAIDDALMEITHVLRGEEHLSNTLRQLMVLEALNLTPPTYGHLSLILDQEGKKLSKRTGASSVSDFMDAGYIPEGLLNYLALLGWSD